MEVLIVQHARKEAGPGDPGLTDEGRRQAAAVADVLAATESPAAVFSSTMRRAVETARPIAERIGVPVLTDERFRERANWDGDGQPLGEFLEEWHRSTADRSYRPLSGDSSEAAAARFLTAIDDIADRHPDGTVVVVAHGGVTCDVLRTVLGDDAVLAAAPTILADGVPPCAVTRLVGERGRWDVAGIATLLVVPEDR